MENYLKINRAPKDNEKNNPGNPKMTRTPKISIITPSLNQASFIEETILSVLSQKYPNLEYLVIDGGSADGTLEILKKYQDHLTWISEKDSGQSTAINKGLRMATGDVVAFLNSDDLYEPGTLAMVGEYFSRYENAFWLTGYCLNIDQTGREIRSFIRGYKNFWLRCNHYQILKVLNFISQPSTFWRRSAMTEVGFLDESLHYTMDYDYWLRLGRRFPLHVIRKNLSKFRLHEHSKSGTTFHDQFDEELSVAKKYFKGLPIFLHFIHQFLSSKVYQKMQK